MTSIDGDFKYNGIPIFEVGSFDFSYIITSHENNNRILSKNIKHDNLREYYKKSRDNAFGIRYEGVLIDMRDLKKDNPKE
jgi:hypothetical protein